MNMKPFLHISYNLALTAILILTSCTKDSLEGINGNGGIEDFTVTLSFQLPETEEVDTKMSSHRRPIYRNCLSCGSNRTGIMSTRRWDWNWMVPARLKPAVFL